MLNQTHIFQGIGVCVDQFHILAEPIPCVDETGILQHLIRQVGELESNLIQILLGRSVQQRNHIVAMSGVCDLPELEEQVVMQPRRCPCNGGLHFCRQLLPH